MDVAVETDNGTHTVEIDDALSDDVDAMNRRRLRLCVSCVRLNLLRLVVHDPASGDILVEEIRRSTDCRQAVVAVLEDLVRRAAVYARAPSEAECNEGSLPA